MVTQRLEALRRTKFYDLFAAAPLIAWYAFCAAHVLPSVSQQIALVKLFVQTDPSALPDGTPTSYFRACHYADFLCDLGCDVCHRHVPQRTAPRFYARCAAVAGTFLSVGIVLLPPQELSSALYLISLILIITGTIFAICASLVLGRSISILPQARRLVTWGPYALVRHPLYLGEIVAVVGVDSSVFVNMGAFAGGTAMRIPTSTHEKRGTGAISSLSGICGLHGTDSLFAAGRRTFLQRNRMRS